jgi:hypothetical protein
MIRKPACLALLVLLSLHQIVAAAPPTRPQLDVLARKLDPITAILGGRRDAFAIQVALDVRIATVPVEATLRFERFDDQTWRLRVEQKDYPFTLERSNDRTTLILPRHRAAIVGVGDLTGPDTLTPRGAALRLIGDRSALFVYYMMLANADGQAVATALTALLQAEPTDAAATHWSSPGAANVSLRVAEGKPLTLTIPDGKVSIEPGELANKYQRTEIPAGYSITRIDRNEMERMLARGTRRALEVLLPGPKLTNPPHQPKKVAHGRLTWVQDQRLILLRGTPAQVGQAHGQLMAEQITLNRDSVLYLVGIAQTMRTGRWALDDLREIWRRLDPFIPEDHKVEMAALANAAGLSIDEVQMTNVFPELFHCSGFAVFGKATKDGKLYHGRVLDYMTRIGLQDAAGIFVIEVTGKTPFATVGYAGFIGSVSGMNADQVSLGEMGGAGEGQWDGVPMATLMRRALEECSTLEAVMQLWTDSPRTCEYYYVFADGKGPTAVGVAATPDSIEFIQPGQDHPRLGSGIEDTVLLSAGGRLEKLRQRAQSAYGSIDIEQALGLMARPVAMSSNLHNVLFVPQDLLFYVAHADHRNIAADRPYVKFDLAALIDELP